MIVISIPDKEQKMSAITGETLIFGQKEGGDISLVVYGDEFYARYETVDGYSVIYDRDRGSYCYVELLEGQFASTGVPTTKAPPVSLPRHLKESDRVRNRLFKSRYEMLRPPETVGETGLMRTHGPNDGLLTGRQVTSGAVRGLTILVEFADVSSSVSREDIDLMLNSDAYKLHGNYCSVRQYYRLMSSDKLDYTNDVVGPVKLSKEQSYYINNRLMEEALDLAIAQFDLDLSRYDSKNEGTVDALSFLYAGRTLYKNWLWPHNSVLSVRRQGVKIHYYTIQSMGRRAVDLSIGTFTHETGHMLCRFPDLYDYGQRDGDFEKSAGLGSYCLMSSGNHLGYGKTPSPLSAYLRDLVSWCDTKINLNAKGTYTAKHGDYGTLLRYSTNIPNEYFLVENRSQNDLDRYLPSDGLAIYHCDRRGSNEYEDGTPQRHYQCALLQADGNRDLENNFGKGDAGDLFTKVEGIGLNDTTSPASHQWDGNDSGFIVSNISDVGETITFETGKPEENSLTVSQSPDLLIPDDNDNGIVSTIDIAKHGDLEKIGVRVDISHTYQGDLRVTLESPGGTRTVLHASDRGAQQDDLHLDLHSDNNGALAGLKGEDISGAWKLHVADLLQDDVGRLDYWELRVDYESGADVIGGELSPALAIPDNDNSGVTSTMTFEADGKLEDVEVKVTISHTYIGDLQLELLSPSGNIAILQSPSGLGDDNMDRSFTFETTPGLAVFVGEDVTGDWLLKVRDLARLDSGTLEYWALKFQLATKQE